MILIITSGITSLGEMSRNTPNKHSNFFSLVLFLFFHGENVVTAITWKYK